MKNVTKINYSNETQAGFFDTLAAYAQGKTVTYFVQNIDCVERIADLLLTIEAMSSKVDRSASLRVGDDYYSFTEYRFPSAFVNRINAGKVYLTRESLGFSEPLHKSATPSPDDWAIDYFVEGSKDAVHYVPKLLTPLQVSVLYERYNCNQGKSENLLTSTEYVHDYVYLTDFKELLVPNTKDSLMMNFTDGKFDGKLAVLAGITSPFALANAPQVPMYSKDSFRRWYFGNNSTVVE